jgi:HNH endonuclease
MKCPDCGEQMRYTRCTAPGCTAYGCFHCGRGCDLLFKAEVLSRCANSIADAATEAWKPQAIIDVFRPMVDTLAGAAAHERNPVVRTGERAPISSELRRGIFARDRGRCQLCGGHAPHGELDHIVPWSAGGSDRSSNLRLTCLDCNQQRSNYVTVADAHFALPIARSCQACAWMDGWAGSGDKIEAFCLTCRRTSTAYESVTI